MAFNSSNKIKIEGGISSMTDLVFLLLIFFIMVASMVNESHIVDLPEGAGDPSETSPLKVYITKEEIKENGKTITVDKFFLNEYDSPYYTFNDIIKKIDSAKLIPPTPTDGKRKKEIIIELLADKKAERQNAYEIIKYAKLKKLKVIIKTKGG